MQRIIQLVTNLKISKINVHTKCKCAQSGLNPAQFSFNGVLFLCLFSLDLLTIQLKPQLMIHADKNYC